VRRVGIFYFSRIKSEIDQQRIRINDVEYGFIRVENILTTADLSSVLSLARPRRGEVVMNTHYLDEES
jgi:heterodisulfide reductase subunit A-like polyferredoxin